jgi:hypothetical protein
MSDHEKHQLCVVFWVVVMFCAALTIEGIYPV